jgi:putative chitinase
MKAPIQISLDLLKKVSKGYGNATLMQGLVDTFNSYAGFFGIDRKEEIGQFLAQSCHESDHYKTTKEYATGAAYEGRKDLGNIYKGDGVKFKGHGIFQTTGRSNHARVGKRILSLPFITDTEKLIFANDAILKNPELLCIPKWAAISAMIYWQDKKLDTYALPIGSKCWYKRYRKDMSAFSVLLDAEECMCRAINGGLNGYSERKAAYRLALKLL